MRRKGGRAALPLARLASRAGPANFDDRLLALSVARAWIRAHL